VRRLLLILLVLGALAGLGWSVLPTGEEAQAPAFPEVVGYVALGDSLATGAGASTSYVERYAERVRHATGAEVVVTNLAADGWTTADLLAALRDDPRFRDAVAGADLLTWDIGGNDLLAVRSRLVAGECAGDRAPECLAEVVADFRGAWDEVVAEVADLRADHAALRSMDLYHPFVALERALGLATLTGPVLADVNEHIHESGRVHGFGVAGVHEAFNGPDGTEDPVGAGLISDDRLHPSDRGHEVMAEALDALGYDDLRR
jgi:lysophospholipase L1-like esterase